jgi:alpha-tubulin suppressor-like RCC1 family protein
VQAEYLPRRIEALDGIQVETVAARHQHVLALARCGRVYAWGTYGCLSIDLCLGLENESDDGDDGDGVDRGDEDDDFAHDGDDYTPQADNEYVPPDADEYIPHMVRALLGVRVRAIAAGWRMSCAITGAGALYTWEGNDDGNLGHGDDRERNRPKLVAALQGICVVGVSMDHRHALARAADGSVYAFGEGRGLGLGDVDAMHTPQRIPNLVCMVPRL